MVWSPPSGPAPHHKGGRGPFYTHSRHTLYTFYILYALYTIYTDSIHLYILYTLTTSCSPFLTTQDHWGGEGGGGRYWCIYIYRYVCQSFFSGSGFFLKFEATRWGKVDNLWPEVTSICLEDRCLPAATETTGSTCDRVRGGQFTQRRLSFCTTWDGSCLSFRAFLGRYRLWI